MPCYWQRAWPQPGQLCGTLRPVSHCPGSGHGTERAFRFRHHGLNSYRPDQCVADGSGHRVRIRRGICRTVPIGNSHHDSRCSECQPA